MDEKKTHNETTLNVSGMTCVNCAKTVENALMKMEGITSVNTNFAIGKAVVEHDKKIVFSDLKKTVEDAGYKLIEDFSQNKLDEYKKEIRKNLILILIGLSLTIPIFIINMFLDFN